MSITKSVYEIFEFLCAKVGSIIYDYPTSGVIVLGGFNVHNKLWSGYEIIEFVGATRDSIINDYSSSEKIVLGGFNVHNKEWL